MKNKKNKLVFKWALVILWMAFIFMLSSISDFSPVIGKSEKTSNSVSSVAHVFEYVVLTWLLVGALKISGLPYPRAIAYAFGLAVIYGASDEFHQYFVPGREVHVSDWLLDVVGAFMVVSIYRYKIKK